jgi:hypothetical protein
VPRGVGDDESDFGSVRSSFRRGTVLSVALVVAAAIVVTIVARDHSSARRAVAVAPRRASTTTMRPTPGVVAWVDRPAPTPASASTTTLPMPDSCSPGSVRLTKRGDDGAAAGTAIWSVMLENNGALPCAVTTPARGAATLFGHDRRVQLLLNGFEVASARLEPGESIWLKLAAPDRGCGPNQDQPPPRYVDVTLTIASQDLAAPGLQLATCGQPSFGAYFETISKPPQPGAVGSLLSSISRVEYHDRVLDFVVTLANPSAVAVKLDPCPSYSEYLGAARTSGPVAARAFYFLNCDTTRSIAPKASVKFAIRAAVPESFTGGGFTKLVWQLSPDGPAAGDVVNIP